MKTKIHFLLHSGHFSLEWKKVSDKICRENRNTYFIFNIYIENRDFYEIIKKNVE